ncbi:MAG: N-acetyltransferase [Verrucomicrobia bacterium]|nr:MAG: N-acetyltransferase [Verrucomicrobiota bacterium]
MAVYQGVLTNSPDYPIRAATRNELPVLAALADRVWRAYYPGIISPGQIEYMLGRGYAIPTLEAELESGVLFPLLFDRQNAVGFGAYGPTGTPLQAKLHKLYLDTDYHGLGLGQRLLDWIESSAHSNRYTRLVLQVNKNNTRAIAAYQRKGYAIEREVVDDIGHGYLMDDYVMEKSIA